MPQKQKGAKPSKIVIFDPRTQSPDYEYALLKALRGQGLDTRLLISDAYFLPMEEEEERPGRRYYFLRVARAFRRRHPKGAHWMTLYFLLGGTEYLLDCVRFLIYCLRERPLIHVQWLCIPIWDVFYLACLRLLGFKIVHTMHNVLPHDREHWGNRLLWGTYYRVPHFLIVHGYSFLNELKRQGISIPKSRLAVVPYGLALQYLPEIPRSQARREMGWGDDELVLVFVGSVTPYKGLDVLLEAMDGLEGDKRVRLVLAVHWDESDRLDNERQINRLSERFTVEVREGVPSTENMRQLACGADLWVLPYRSASHSFVASIAQRYGTGMVVTDVGELPHVLGEELKAWQVPPERAEELGGCIARYLELDENQREHIGRMLKDKGFKEARWEKVAKKTSSLYDYLNIPSIQRV